jgi:hypothetical protein
MGITSDTARKRIAYITIALVILSLAYLAGQGFRSRRQVAPPDLAGGLERDNRQLGEADLERLFPDIVLRAKKGDEKLIALTFDDGPDDVYTPAVLDVLFIAAWRTSISPDNPSGCLAPPKPSGDVFSLHNATSHLRESYARTSIRVP